MEGELIQQSSTIIGAIVGAVIIFGLIYFVYTRVKKAYAKRNGTGSGRDGDGSKTVK